MNQELKFLNEFTNSKFKLFKFPKNFFNSITCLKIKGKTNGLSFLITNKQTFKIMKIETSNSLLLKDKNLINDDLKCYYELELFKPSLVELYQLLNNNYFNGEIINKKSRKVKSYTLNDLNEMLIASEYEIKLKLKEIRAIEVDGFCKLIEPSVLNDHFNTLLLSLTENDWNYNKIPIDECINCLNRWNKIILNYCFETFGSISEDKKYCKLNINEILLYRAQQLFETSNKWNIELFKSSWKNSCENLNVEKLFQNLDLSLLNSLSVIHDKDIIYINKSLLSNIPKDRIKELFKIKPKWKKEELKIFLNDFEDIFEKLLKKFTKCNIISKSLKLYTSK